jgi:alkyl sulfatase BDS1-like metallo-beta-lactamase superfamily hydrolase
VHVAVGFALANSILLEAPEGLIVVDTTETQYAAAEVLKAFRAVSDRPIRAIIYTHSHEDHIGGAQVGERERERGEGGERELERERGGRERGGGSDTSGRSSDILYP